MKKSNTKKLAISKETLRNLERVNMGKVAGAATVVPCLTQTNCCSGHDTCATCATQCGTKLC